MQENDLFFDFTEKKWRLFIQDGWFAAIEWKDSDFAQHTHHLRTSVASEFYDDDGLFLQIGLKGGCHTLV